MAGWNRASSDAAKVAANDVMHDRSGAAVGDMASAANREMLTDTIVAISTAQGRGGIGVVRLSGPQALAIASPMLRLRRPLAAGRACFAQVLDLSPTDTANENAGGSGAGIARDAPVLDEAVVTYFAAPHSYTSEDVVEISVHGAPVLLTAVVRGCVARGARLARPGEFTERAFLSGRIDLTQAEAVEDLIAATTLEQARTAARQLGGGLSRQVAPIKERLIALIAALEAGIDFAEDDLEVLADAAIHAQLAAIEAPLAALEATFRYGRVLREGVRLAIVGQPNVGKSSLFNRLIERERAIVTAEPGTTRDPVEERLAIEGIPIELVDTAGLRETMSEAETIGVAKSYEAIAEADLVLLVVAADQPLGPRDLALLGRAEGSEAFMLSTGSTLSRNSTLPTNFTASQICMPSTILVVNKIDLSPSPSVAERSLSEAQHRQIVRVETSALEQTGIAALRQAILAALNATPPSADTATVTNERQHEAIVMARRALAAASHAASAKMPHEMLLLDLYEALSGLDQLTGTTTPDDVLHLIFSRFCIGK